ncbi:MAG TPA: sigma-54-dependent Fis family transcriptional regulator [bacterium]|nr:sigma-54-dependent Fis family transcriptional regulator [bacterium]
MDDTIVGAEKGLAKVMERVRLVARSDVPVIIFGETGTGKEVIARAIHNSSTRAAGPFIRVNCGAIPPELIDSQLFGHERGAFTGAVESRKGWFERADGGTLLLDEVAELPLPAQVRFLRILQDGWLERVGGKHPIKVDVRIVLATHRDLATMVAKGKFREDLWYRIATFPVFLPPLRDRIEDLKELAEHFARRSAIRFGLPTLLPTDDDLKILAAYSWPGNIRELGAVIDRAALLGNGKRLEIKKSLGWNESYEQHQNSISTNGSQQNFSGKISSLDDAVKKHISQALALTTGRIEGNRGAAELLKINPHTLRARMRKLGIKWTDYRK